MFSNSKIKKVSAREVIDSRGNPTLEVTVVTGGGAYVAGVPSGASTGQHEAVELRDGNISRFNGLGVLKAVENVNGVISPQIVGMDARDKAAVDTKMIEIDGTTNLGRLGANATCGVSLAVARAAAADSKIPLYRHIAQLFKNNSPALPKACFNIINGGAHAGSNLDVQEFMIVPQSDKFSDNLRATCEIYHQLKKSLIQKYGRAAGNLGDEGGFAPPMESPKEALECISEAVVASQTTMPIKFILDVAASQFFEDGKYNMHVGSFDGHSLADFYTQTLSQFTNIIGLEDPFAEDDWPSWQGFSFTGMMIGDDLLVTNPDRIKEAREKKACNATIIKINQIGTLTRAMEAARLAKSYGWKTVVSHRSGETNDDFIADFAVGIASDYIKTGAPARGERLAKYNRLAKIEEEIV